MCPNNEQDCNFALSLYTPLLAQHGTLTISIYPPLVSEIFTIQVFNFHPPDPPPAGTIHYGLAVHLPWLLELSFLERYELDETMVTGRPPAVSKLSAPQCPNGTARNL